MHPISTCIDDLTYLAKFFGWSVFVTAYSVNVTGSRYKTVYIGTSTADSDMEEFLIAETKMNGIVIHADVHTFGSFALVGLRMPVAKYPLAHYFYLNTSTEDRKYI